MSADVGEVGYAHSSVDRRDNITLQERRGITINNVFKERTVFQIGFVL